MRHKSVNACRSLQSLRSAYLLSLVAALAAGSASGFAAGLNVEVTLSTRSGPPFYSEYAQYTSWGGINNPNDPQANANFAFEPDGDLGHLSYRIQGTQTLFDPLWEKNFVASGLGRSDWGHGGLHAFAGATGDCQSLVVVQVDDKITFTNTTSQDQAVTIRFVIHGGMSVGAMYSNDGSQILRYGRAAAVAYLAFSGPGGGGGTVNGVFGLDNSPAAPPPESNYGNITPGGWDDGESVEVTMDPGNKSGTFVAHFTVSPGERTYELLQKITLDSRGVAETNYSDTAGLEIVVPPGVSFTSESGNLLTSGSRLVNISTRARVLGGDSVAIGGFIVTGNVPKKIIIRGIGPSLSGFGVPGALADTTLELNQNGTVLATNDNWRETQQTEIQNAGLAPGNELESAIVRTLNPGSYTAVLRGKNNGTGVGLVEVYDLDAPADAKLSNISTRAIVEAGDNVLIGGIIGGGNGSQPKTLIRAIGPSLTAFGVPNALHDPVLELRDRNGALVATNNDWQSDQAAVIQATGLAPSNTKESAIIATLQPTNYTAIVKGAGNTSGVGLVEVYHLQ